MADVPQITWFRSAYVVAEDRLRLTCSLEGGETETFWLTHRLANALVKQLVNWLDNTVAEDRSGPFANSIAQQSAVAKAPEKRREALPDQPGRLIDTVNVKLAEKAILLTFKDASGHAARVTFDAPHLRRWLQGLHEQYRRAEWSVDEWPDWVIEQSNPEPAPPAVRLN
jgi:hypothetical protein